MAESNENVFTMSTKGMVGKQMVFSQRAGKTFMGKRPAPSRNAVLPQSQAIRDKFKLATLYAKKQILDPVIKAAYQAAAGPRASAYTKAVTDYLVSPEIRKIKTALYTGAIGSKLSVTAVDDFKVVRLTVSIRNANGDLLETGEAVEDPIKIDWVYTSTVLNAAVQGTTITAEAFDTPGNSGVLEITL
jgi:hypothetical protein